MLQQLSRNPGLTLVLLDGLVNSLCTMRHAITIVAQEVHKFSRPDNGNPDFQTQTDL